MTAVLIATISAPLAQVTTAISPAGLVGLIALGLLPPLSFPRGRPCQHWR